MAAVYIKECALTPTSIREVLRYAGAQRSEGAYEALIQDCIREASPLLSPRVCYTECPLTLSADLGTVHFGFTTVSSADLSKNLRGCTRAILFAATVGPALDRLIAKYSTLSPTKALFLDALGVERIEALCDGFCSQLEKEMHPRGLCLKPRFSPGYGDLPLDFQKTLFSLLDCPKKIGLTLNESMLMSPSKSVTALIGLYENKDTKL